MSTRPAYTFPMKSCSPDEAYLPATIQGLLNQTAPRLYLDWSGFPKAFDEADAVWLDYFPKRFGVEWTHLSDLGDLLNLAREITGGHVLFDPRVGDSRNYGLMLAAQNNWLLAHPCQQEQLDAAGFTCTHDLRGRFWEASRTEMYRQAYDTFFKDCNPRIVSNLDAERQTIVALNEIGTNGGQARIQIEALHMDTHPEGAELKHVEIRTKNRLLAQEIVGARGADTSALGHGTSGEGAAPEPFYEFTFDIPAGETAYALIYTRGTCRVYISENGNELHAVHERNTPMFQGGYTHNYGVFTFDHGYANKVFTFSLSASPGDADEYALRDTILKEISPCGIVLGWHTDRDFELNHLQHCSHHGNTVHCCLNVGNLSFAQHLKPESVRIPDTPPTPEIKKDKVYLSVISGDGDALWCTYSFMGGFFRHPRRGEIPMGWGLQSQASELAPGFYTYYIEHAGENDCLVAASSGVGYSYPDCMPTEQLDAHLKESRRVFDETGFRVMQVYPTPRECGSNGVPPEQRHAFQKHLAPQILGIQEGYWAFTPPADEILDDMVWSHTRLPEVSTFGGPRPAMFKAELLRIIKETPHRPLFIPTHPWIEEMPIEDTLAILDELGDEIEVVRPDHFYELWKQYGVSDQGISYPPKETDG